MHNDSVDVYKLKDNEYIKLCWNCAAKLGLCSKENPVWDNQEKEEIEISKEELLNFAKQNPQLKVSPTIYNKGWFFSNKNNKNIFYRSSLELKHLKEMEIDSNIAKFSRGPRITYEDYTNGKKFYFIDWKIWDENGKTKLVETKPLDLLKIGLDKFYPEEISIIPKLESVEEYCKQTNQSFEYWT